MDYFLAIDIGASSGRHIIGCVQNGKIILEEIHRFDNGIKDIDGELCWDVDTLFAEIIIGMQKCKTLNKVPKSMAIDTWAVDFVLLDKNKKKLENVVSYRDGRTNEIDQEVYKIISQEKLYQRTGIQKQVFNTIYQLMAIKKNNFDLLNQVESMLLIPDYFQYLLTGIEVCEYTNATTTQLVNPLSKDWDDELIVTLGYPRKIFNKIVKPGTKLGKLLPSIKKLVEFDTTVIATTSHDTASAVTSIPSQNEDIAYISSGTWSLMGIERNKADCSSESMVANFTNEGGYEYRFRYLKNLMGLWIIQSVRKEFNNSYSFTELCEQAKENNSFPSRIDVNDDKFLAPISMISSIQNYCKDTNQLVPKSVGEISSVVYQSLAESYAKTLHQIERLTGKKLSAIHIVGGGGNAEYLNKLTAKAVRLPIYVGPIEATATGNLVVQMIASQVFSSLQEARDCIRNSNSLKKYE